jgi:hypothetical protein
LRGSGFESLVPRMPGLIWVLGPWAGDVMVDGSFRWGRLRLLGLWWTAACGRESRKLRELAGRLAAIEGVVGLAERVRRAGLGDGFERLGTEFAQRVEAAAGELAGDRQGRPGV